MGYLGNAPADQAIQIGSDTILSSHIDDGVIVNDDINASASISVSKTALAGGTGLTLSTNTLNVDAAQTQINSVGTIGTGVWQGTKVASAYLDDDTAHLSGSAFTGTISSSTGSTTDSVLTLSDAGVADYKFTFPDTSTIRLSTSTSSDKTLDITNAGSGVFALNVEGTVTVGASNGSEEVKANRTRVRHIDGLADASDYSHGDLYVNHISTGNIYMQRDTTFAGVILGANGSVSAPAFAFSSDTNTGMYREGAGSIGFTRSGEKTVAITANQLGVFGGEGDHVKFIMYADEGDDDNDKYRIEAQHTGGGMEFQTATTGSWASMLTLSTTGSAIVPRGISFSAGGSASNNSIYHNSNNWMYVQGGTAGLALKGENSDDSCIYLNNASQNISLNTNNANRVEVTNSLTTVTTEAQIQDRLTMSGVGQTIMNSSAVSIAGSTGWTSIKTLEGGYQSGLVIVHVYNTTNAAATRTMILSYNADYYDRTVTVLDNTPGGNGAAGLDFRIVRSSDQSTSSDGGGPYILQGRPSNGTSTTHVMALVLSAGHANP